MKKLVLFSLCALLLASCDDGRAMKEKLLQEQKNQDELINALDRVTGSGEAHSELRGKKYLSDEIDKAKYLCSFAETSNTAILEQYGVAKAFCSDDYAVYTVSGNTVSFDFSKQIAARKSLNRELFMRGYVPMGKRYIAELTEQLKDPSLSPEKKAELQKKLDDSNVRLAKLEAKIEKGEFSMADIGITDEQMDFSINHVKIEARVLETINPITVTLSDDKKTITLSKFHSTGFKKKADGTFDYDQPIIKTDVVFTRQE